TETTSLDSRSAKIVVFSFAFDAHKGYYVPLAHNYIGAPEQIALQDAHEAIAKIVQHPLIGHNLKFDLEVIAYNFGIDVNPNNLCDTMILAWMLDSDQPLGLDSLAKKWLNHTMIAFSDVVPKRAIFSDVLLDTATQYAAEDAQATFALYEILMRQIETADSNLLDVAKKLEFPFISVIQCLEENGICIDVPFFESLKKPIAAQLLALTEEIYRYAQCSFNINSPLQLGEILFERLKLPCKKRTKNGYSTNESVLLSLKDTHPIIPPLLQYREVFKLQSTYIEPLLQLAKNQKSPRIHSSFLQTGTATGRLSSRNPNLQNIPVRTDLGKQIREGFIAESGFVLLSLDYSQIELRLLAHFSGDSTLTNAFFEGADIHYETAKKIFSAELAKQKRA
ncbi:MAG: DNA polymerase I, partial [Helicobacter sp.]|nr:DNA polymerase I [Helicobacter sp.]